MPILKETDNNKKCITKLCQNNPGCIRSLVELAEYYDSIKNPHIEVLGLLHLLDEFEIYGTDIYILWNDKCNQDIKKFILLIRATQFNIVTLKNLKRMAEDQSRKFNFSDKDFELVEDQVKDALGG